MRDWRTAGLGGALFAGAALVFGVGCQREAAPQPALSACPPAPACSSDCSPEGAAHGPTVAGPGPSAPAQLPVAQVPELQASGEIGELSASASRKMFHDDGAGCLADLDRIAQLQPSLDKQLATIRGQCEMLVGRCQEGKKRIADYFVVETDMSPERAATTAEQMGSMRCRGGNSTPRDELLRALYELSDAAYMNKREPAYCKERVAIIRRLGPTVPAGPEDTQIEGGRKALFQTAATCFVKAGDCPGAMAVYRDNYPYENLGAVPNPQDREKIIREGFASSFAACGGAVP